MTRTIALTALALVLAACNKDAGGNAATAGADPAARTKPTAAVTAPADGDWSNTYSMTDAGSFIMGNPDAKVRLIEYGSMTCPHCAEFEEQNAPKLVEQWIKTGKASWEFRNYVRDPYDLTAALVARCGGAGSFWGLTRGMYATQRQWMGTLMEIPQDQLAQLEGMGATQRFGFIADKAGFTDFAALRGVAKDKTAACLADEAAATRLVDGTNAVNDRFPQFPGTPSFEIDGKLVEMEAGKPLWDQLDAALKAAS